MKRPALFLGRFQPFHAGHEAMIQALLDEGQKVIIGIMDTEFGPDNPYTLRQRMSTIIRHYANEPNVDVQAMPWVGSVVYGRNVGYDIRRIHLDPEIEAISATEIRGGRESEVNTDTA